MSVSRRPWIVALLALLLLGQGMVTAVAMAMTALPVDAAPTVVEAASPPCHGATVTAAGADASPCPFSCCDAGCSDMSACGMTSPALMGSLMVVLPRSPDRLESIVIPAAASALSEHQLRPPIPLPG